MATTITITDSALLRLMQLSSVSLPVGGYAFSQGMEYAIDTGWVKKEADVENWIAMQLTHSVARVDLPLLKRVMQAAETNDVAKLVEWNDLALACRETAELRLTDTAMGEALTRLMRNLGMKIPDTQSTDISFVTLFGCAAVEWGIKFDAAALGFSWAWLENQVAGATKLVPLGQTQSQRLLGALQPAIPPAIELANTLDDEQIGATLPAMAIASARHEIQYSRLFRS